MTHRLARLVVWFVAVTLALVVSVWLARVTGWLSGERLVDAFTGSGFGRYARILALAPVWALLTALFVSLLIEADRILTRRRAQRAPRSADAPAGLGATHEELVDDPGVRGGRHLGVELRAEARRTTTHRGCGVEQPPGPLARNVPNV
jgi:hypothetical protein